MEEFQIFDISGKTNPDNIFYQDFVPADSFDDVDAETTKAAISFYLMIAQLKKRGNFWLP